MPQGPRARLRRYEWRDERSLALGQATAERLRADPTLIAKAATTLDRWEALALERGDQGALSALKEWRRIIETSTLDELIRLLGEDTSQRATRLRRSRPFVGIISEEERAAIFARFEEM